MRARWLVFVFVCACGKVSTSNSDGPVTTDANVDAPVQTADARLPDAMPDKGTPGQELVSGGHHLTGGVYTMDVQIGNPFSQQPATGGGKTFQGNAPVKP
jgi:hypothetical protein